jgi:hypothetical protein
MADDSASRNIYTDHKRIMDFPSPVLEYITVKQMLKLEYILGQVQFFACVQKHG